MKQVKKNRNAFKKRLILERKDVTYSILRKPICDTELTNYYYYTELYKASE